MKNLLYLSIFVAIATYTEADVTFDITNTESGPVWIGIQGNSGQPALENGGFVLESGQTQTVTSPDNWSGRFWARTWCDSGTQHCLTGDCGNKLECNGAGGAPPVTLVEITLKGTDGNDFYDVSLVDGFNTEAYIEPVDQQSSGQYSCTRDACTSDINSKCPEDLRVIHNDETIACNSACNQFDTDEYCCRGEHNTLETCRSSDWPTDYPAFFKEECPDAYSYAFDDHKSTFTCKSSHYKIQFGP